MSIRGHVALLLVLTCLSHLICTAESLKDAGHKGEKFPVIRARFRTKDKVKCALVVRGEDTYTLTVTCKPENGGEFTCTYTARPATCPAFGTKPDTYWTQITRSLIRQKKTCSSSPLRAGMCKSAPDAQFKPTGTENEKSSRKEKTPGTENEKSSRREKMPGTENEKSSRKEKTPGTENEKSSRKEKTPGTENEKSSRKEKTPGTENEKSSRKEKTPGTENEKSSRKEKTPGTEDEKSSRKEKTPGTEDGLRLNAPTPTTERKCAQNSDHSISAKEKCGESWASLCKFLFTLVQSEDC